MTITLFGKRITIFKVETLEKPILSVNKAQASKEAQEIMNTVEFKELRERAKQARLNRQGV